MDAKSIISGVLIGLGNRIPLKTLIGISRQKYIFPFYHMVSDGNPLHIKNLYKIKTVQTFENDLDYLLKYFSPLNPEDILSLADQKVVHSKPGFFLSFDDGLKEFYEIIAPVLLRKGIPAVCFLNSAFVDNCDMFYRYKASLIIEQFKNQSDLINHPSVIHWLELYRVMLSENKMVTSDVEKSSNILNKMLPLPSKNSKDIIHLLNHLNYAHRSLLDELALIISLDITSYLKNEKPYMDSNQINTLIQKGFYFGAHSIDHPLYNQMTMGEQIHQTETSCTWVQKRFGLKYKFFAFPFTDHGVSNSFFRHFSSEPEKLDLTFGTAGLKKDKFKNHFQRIPMETFGTSAENILKTEYLYFLMKALIGKNTIQRS